MTVEIIGTLLEEMAASGFGFRVLRLDASVADQFLFGDSSGY